ncbi:MAG: sigma-70 family RNA polymerase sigma factor [Ruminococcaceae bacterium]|nr:sigma-70 family RNA polymerase sigma factor [Oscillospiraceae bacterium]
MIIGEIRRYLRDNNMIRVSRSVRDTAYKALTAREKLSVLLSRDPTIEEITEEVNKRSIEDAKEKSITTGVETEPIQYTVKAVSDALDAVVVPVSLYEPVYSDSGDSIYIMDQLCDNKNNDSVWTESIAIGEALKKLSDRESKIINMRFFLGKTQMEVASEVGISQAQVSRLEKGALASIKKNI